MTSIQSTRKALKLESHNYPALNYHHHLFRFLPSLNGGDKDKISGTEGQLQEPFN